MVEESSKEEAYLKIRESYNSRPNGADLLFLSRSCYGGVVRFRKADGYMSTPCGVHTPIPVESFSKRVAEWQRRTKGADFRCVDYTEAMSSAKKGDVVYCDPIWTASRSCTERRFLGWKACSTRFGNVNRGEYSLRSVLTAR